MHILQLQDVKQVESYLVYDKIRSILEYTLILHYIVVSVSQIQDLQQSHLFASTIRQKVFQLRFVLRYRFSRQEKVERLIARIRACIIQSR